MHTVHTCWSWNFFEGRVHPASITVCIPTQNFTLTPRSAKSCHIRALLVVQLANSTRLRVVCILRAPPVRHMWRKEAGSRWPIKQQQHTTTRMHICTHMHTMQKYYGYSSSMCVRMHVYAYSRVDRARDGQKVIQRRSADGRAKGSIHPSFYFIPADTIRGVCIRGGYQITLE